jgi:hypothetical protein
MFVLRKKAATRARGIPCEDKKEPKHLHLFRNAALCEGCEGRRALSHSIRGINVFKALQPLLYRGFALAALATM